MLASNRISNEPVFNFLPEGAHVCEGAVTDDDEEEGVFLVSVFRA